MLRKTGRLRIWTLVTHGAVAMAVLAISSLLSTKTACTQDTPPLTSASTEVTNERKKPTDPTQEYDGVKTYVLFIGHSRSGHSIVGALLDAHPEVLISHELGSNWALWTPQKINPFRRKRIKSRFFLEIHHNSHKEAMLGRRAATSALSEGKHTYQYYVPGQWQGQVRDKLTVIGDKSGHFTSQFFRNPKNLVKLDYLKNSLGVSLKIINVLRNPYDNIATQTLRHNDPHGRGRDAASAENKINKTEVVNVLIRGYFARTEANERIRQNYDVLEIPGSELVLQPKESMQKVCDYVGITCDEDYIDACTKLLSGKPSITRNLIVWTDRQKRLVQQSIKKYSYLRRYSFDSYP